jgi:hypothetical protein
MKFELKNREGKFIWEYHGLVEKPKYTNIRCVLGQMRSTGNYLTQVTLKLHTKQVTTFSSVVSFGLLIFLY